MGNRNACEVNIRESNFSARAGSTRIFLHSADGLERLVNSLFRVHSSCAARGLVQRRGNCEIVNGQSRSHVRSS